MNVEPFVTTPFCVLNITGDVVLTASWLFPIVIVEPVLPLTAFSTVALIVPPVIVIFPVDVVTTPFAPPLIVPPVTTMFPVFDVQIPS